MTDASEVITPASVMWSPSKIAERDGVTQPFVSKTVKRLLERHDLTVERDGRGRIAAINVAQYDMLRERYGDANKAQRERRSAAKEAAESLDEANRQRAWIEAERRRLELDQLRGVLVRKADVEATARSFADVVVREIQRLPDLADELAAAVARNGTHGLRVALKHQANRMRETIAAAVETAAPPAPEG